MTDQPIDAGRETVKCRKRAKKKKKKEGKDIR